MADFWLREATAAFEGVLRRAVEEGRPAARERLAVLRDAYLSLRAAGSDRPLAELEPSGRGDAQVARSKGAWVLWMLRQAVGPLSFREFWSGAEGSPATTEALKKAVVSGQWPAAYPATASLTSLTTHHGPLTTGWDSFFDFWVYSTGLPQYRLLGATVKGAPGEFVVTMKIANRGTGTIAAPLVVQTEEGARHEFALVVPGGGTRDVSYSMVTKPVAAAVDPDGDLLQAEPSGGWQAVKARRWF